MKIYVRVLVRSNIARRQERIINYAPERVHMFPFQTNSIFIIYALQSLADPGGPPPPNGRGPMILYNQKANKMSKII